MDQKERLDLLKQILLTEEKEVTETLIQKVERLSHIINDEEIFYEKVSPSIDRKIENFVDQIPKTLSPVITQALKSEIENSQDAVVEALFPIIGKMIKRYISQEIAVLNEKINTQIKNAFSFKNFFKHKFGKTNLSDEILANSNTPELLQVLVIEKESGLLIANYQHSKENSIDEDMVAGMLTAIKNFVEDAFQGGNQLLETISYELYTLHIQNFHKFYITAVISGTYNATTKQKTELLFLDFAQKGVSKEGLRDINIFSNELKIFLSDKII